MLLRCFKVQKYWDGDAVEAREACTKGFYELQRAKQRGDYNEGGNQ
jgi:hypothetical protein